MKTYEIKELGSVLNLGPEKKIIKYEAKPLTSAGENYGSLMSAVDILIQNSDTNEDETIHLVAKMLPPSDVMKEAFNIQVTFKKEVTLYISIFTELRSFGKQSGFSHPLDFLADFYGYRFSLDSKSTTVDNDAVLLLENLKYSGYITCDRLKGFDVDTAKVILKELAVFHGVSLAYKLLKPKDFEDFMPFLGAGLISAKEDEYNEKLFKKQIELVVTIDRRCAELKDRLQKILASSDSVFESNCSLDNPFGTICHLDLWVNNILVKYENKCPFRIKFVDFQVYCYGNLTRDLVFFLFTSVPSIFSNKLYDKLIQFYHERFIEVLKSFEINVNGYSLEKFHEEIANVAKSSEILHIATMLAPVLAERGSIEDMEKIDLDAIIENEGSDVYRERLTKTLLMFAEKNWL